MALKRPKAVFAGVFAFLKRPRKEVWDACKGGFGPMSAGLGTLVTFRKNGAEITSGLGVCSLALLPISDPKMKNFFPGLQSGTTLVINQQ